MSMVSDIAIVDVVADKSLVAAVEAVYVK